MNTNYPRIIPKIIFHSTPVASGARSIYDKIRGQFAGIYVQRSVYDIAMTTKDEYFRPRKTRNDTNASVYIFAYGGTRIIVNYPRIIPKIIFHSTPVASGARSIYDKIRGQFMAIRVPRSVYIYRLTAEHKLSRIIHELFVNAFL